MRPFPLSDELWLCENAAYLPKLKTLVISDLQLGMEQQLRAAGSNILYEQAQAMLGLLEVLLDQTGAKRLVIDGDLKHEFGRISGQERRDILDLLRRLQQRVEIVVVRGNHDTITGPLVAELGLQLMDFWHQDGFYVVHGHKLPGKDDPMFRQVHTIIIGHVHPAIEIDDGVRNERFKCFLLGTYKQKRLLVLPSFSTIVEGSDVLKVASNSPFFQNDAEVYVLADEIRSFGRISQLRRVLE